MNAEESAEGQLRSWWFCQVHDLSDLDLQRRTWLDPGNTNPHWSYLEFVESYPDRDQLSDALKRGWLTADEFEALSELGRTLESHTAPSGDDYNHAAILKDPAWHAVVAAAERAKRLLVSTTTDQQERKILLGAT